MARTHQEVKDYWTDVVNTFNPLYTKNDHWMRQLSGKWEADLLAKVANGGLIPDEFLQKRAVISDDGRKAIGLRKGKLTRAMDIHIDPEDDRKETRADDEEQLEGSWLSRIGLDTASQLWSDIYEVQSSWKVGGLWRERKEFALPDQEDGESDADYNKRCDAYKKKWFPYSLSIPPLRTLAWTEINDKGSPLVTAAFHTYDIPYLDMLEQYGDYDKTAQRSGKDKQELMLRIGREQFPFLRADEIVPLILGGSGSTSTSLQKRLTVRVVSDGVTCTHHIQGLNARYQSSGNWEQVAEYEEETGRPPLYLIYGAYHPGQPIEDRYQGVDQALFQWVRTRDYCLSFKASYVASATPDGFIIPPAGLNEWLQTPDDQKPTVTRLGNGSISPVPGELISMIATPEALKHNDDVLATAERMVEKFWPSSLLNNGPSSAQLIERGTNSGIARGEEAEESGQQEAVDCAVRVVGDVLRDTRAGFMKTANSHYKAGSKAKDEHDVNFYARVKKGKKTREIDMTPADADFEFTREVTARDTRLTTLVARRQEADARKFRQDGISSITHEEWMEAQGVTNVTEYDQQLVAEALTALERPRMVQQFSDRATQFVAAFWGYDLQEASQQADVNVEGASPNGGNGSNSGGNGNQPQTYTQTAQSTSSVPQ